MRFMVDVVVIVGGGTTDNITEFEITEDDELYPIFIAPLAPLPPYV